MIDLCLSEMAISPDCDCGTCQAIASERHVHRCEFPAEHTDWDHDGSHQCECGEVW